MKINKNKNGITLIALIITIIIMLILASVVVWQAAADDGLIHKVLFSKNKVEDSEIKEKIQAAVLAAKLEGSGKLTVSNLKTELQKLGITAEEDSFPLNVNVEDSKYRIAEDGDVNQVVIVKLTAAQIAANKEAYYGQEVKNYTAGGKTYRIFYVDEAGDFGPANTIYLKADWTDNNYSLSSYTSYTPKTTDILELMNPSWWAQRGTASWNPNEHCAAYLCDPTTDDPASNQAWANYFDNTKANYVIGSPSVEMYVKSYNQVSHTIGNYTLGATYRATSYPGYIYTLNGEQSKISNNDYYTGTDTLDYSKYNSMYCGKDGAKGIYYTWLASPSSDDSNSVCNVNGTYANLRYDYYHYVNIHGVSPLVSLKSGVLPEIEA